MKPRQFIIAFSLLLCSCVTKTNSNGLEYIKIIALGEADSITYYNKGIGLSDYAYFDPKQDSILLRLYSGSITSVNGYDSAKIYRTWVGHIDSSKYIDSLTKLIHLLKRYRDGIFQPPMPEGVTYCGPEFNVEYKDSKGIHLYSFILDGNDTLENFSHFFYHFEWKSWRRNLVNNRILNGDSIAVATMKKTGYYYERENPYLPVICGQEIVPSKIYGSWRSVSERGDIYSSTYNKLTLMKDQTFKLERILNGALQREITRGKFVVRRKDNTFILKSAKGKIYPQRILRLSDACFEFIDLRHKYTKYRYDRL